MTSKSRLTRLLPRLALGLLGLFILIQLVPYGRTHSNPAVQAAPNWDSPQTKTLFARACADCHSNETKWPWYSNIAPISWSVQQHVDEGRSKFNASVPGFGEDAKKAANEVAEGGMPLPSYLPMHPEARLSDTEKQQLIAGLKATFGSEAQGGSTGNTEKGEKNGD